MSWCSWILNHQVLEAENALIATGSLSTLHVDSPTPWQYDVLDVGDDRVPIDHSGGAECLFDLAVHLRLRVLHEYGGVGVALRHLLLAL